MFKRILIANRGEIALRIIRCCREMDIETVIVYSTADKNSLAVMAADKAVCIGPAKAAESYLNQDAIIETAILTGCEAVHPGYGFLSENAAFARKCEENNLIFIGPSADIISSMGDKQSARQLMLNAGFRLYLALMVWLQQQRKQHTLQKELVILYLLKRQLEAVEKECARHSAEKI